MRTPRRRGLVLLALALACGGLAASQVRERERSVAAKVGPLVPVVVAAQEIEADRPLRSADLALERVPARFVPPDALGSAEHLQGSRSAVPLAAGSYVTAGALRGARAGGGGALAAGQRALEVGVSGGLGLAGAGPGSRVDVLVSVRRHEGSGRTFVALEDVELLELRAASGSELSDDSRPDTALATLRVSVRQAVYLAAADNFGHELRLLVRPPGDRRSAAGYGVAEGEL